MKNIKLTFLTIISIVFLSGCYDKTELVKNGILDIDKSITVGQAFNNYKYFSTTKWRHFKTENKRNIVEITGTFTDVYLKLMRWEKNTNKCDLIVQFKINEDDTFEFYTLGFNFIDKKGKKIEKSAKELNLSPIQMIQSITEIYNNVPLS